MATILLVEDEPLVLQTLAAAIESKGHAVVTATNGNEGLEKFAERPFDLVVTDIVMPQKEGMETIIELRRLDPDVKILAISGGGRTGNLEFLKMAEGLGAVTSLKKPIKLAELFEALGKCLDESPAAAKRA